MRPWSATRKAPFGRLILAFSLVAVPCLAGAYQEAPVLAERVARGELPPVEERLPENPAVTQPIDEIGKYGGTWRRLAVGAGDFSLTSRLGYEPFVRWDQTGRHIVPGVAERWEVLDDGRAYVFHLRKGMRWSDGQPFTSEDLVFFYEDVLQDEELTPVFPAWLTIDEEPVRIAAPDAYTVEFRFAKPHGLFLEYVAFQGGYVLFPKHYLRQFHPKYSDLAEIERMAREEEFDYWYQLFGYKSNALANPELPTLKPFVLQTEPPALRVIAARNPYYWKVDPEGNQLPYIDEIAFVMVANPEILNFKAMTGETDFQARRIDTANYPVFMMNREQGRYHVMRDLESGSTVIYINQYSKDEELCPILQDRRFRIALSVAIDRQELIDLIYSGMAAPARGVAGPFDPYYLPEFDEQYLEYDPARANLLLDDLGFRRGPSGLRRLPSGGRFRQILNVFPSEAGSNMEMWQLIAEYWREVGLEFVVKTDAPTLSRLQVINGNSDFWAYATAGMHWVVDPVWFVPWFSSSYFAPLFGRYRQTHGKGGVKPPPEYQRLVDWYLELRSVVNDDVRKLELGQRILGQWADECYTIGICRKELLTIVSDRFRNVPDQIIHSYRLMTPGYIGIEQFFLEE